jgi:hypothetical protein
MGMPYQGEFAQYDPLRRVVNDQRVNSLLTRSKIHPQISTGNLPRINFADIAPSQFRPTHVIAIDGSNIPVSVQDGYPGAEIGYVTVASVILNLELLDELDTNRPVNPVTYRQTEDAESIDSVFPGCNIVLDEELSAKSSLRKVIFELLNEKKLFEDGESLLDTYESLLQYKPDEDQRCPYSDMYEDICLSRQPTYTKNMGRYQCNCLACFPVYSTDALRLHERFHPDGTNAAIYTEIMQVLERLWLIHILRGFEAKGYLRLLRNFAFVIDGPLAVFGQPAWLSQAIKQELKRLNRVAKPYTDGLDMLIVGIEKSGSFVTHFEQLVLTKREDAETALSNIPFNQLATHHMNNSLIPPQTACLLTDEYIKRNIIYSESERPYGRQTYFGRKFFYRTKSGAQIVASLPFLEDYHENIRQANPDQYPRLADAMALFDQLVSSRHPNSLAPVVSAHAEAAIPLNLGKKVLERMAHELMQRS